MLRCLAAWRLITPLIALTGMKVAAATAATMDTQIIKCAEINSMKSSSRDHAEESSRDVKGKVKEVAGKPSDDPEIKGMGAILHTGGVGFRVWAPHAERVSVIGSFNGWDGDNHPMQAEKHGYEFHGIVRLYRASSGYGLTATD